MNTTKKLFATLLAVMMMASMLVMPSAAAGYSITIKDSNHYFDAYQIFYGGLHEGVLSNVHWGTGIDDAAALLAELKADPEIGSYFTDCATAKDVAEVMGHEFTGKAHELLYTDIFAKHVANQLSETSKRSVLSGNDSVVSNLDAGYYILIDRGPNGDDTLEPGDAYNKYIVQVSNNVSVSPKVAAPTMHKTANRTEGGTFTEAVSASVGDSVYFKLEGMLHDRMGDYGKYYYKVVDTLPAGLTFDSIASIGVYNVNNLDAADNTDYIPAAALADDAVLLSNYGVTITKPTGAGGQVIIEIDDVKAFVQAITGAVVESNDHVVIKIKTTVNANIDIGLDGSGKPGNVNKVQLTYSNNPNNWEDYKTDVGTTAEDTAYVYCYGLKLVKVNQANTSEMLDGAIFVVSRVEGTVTKYAVFDGNNVLQSWDANIDNATKLVTVDGTFTVYGLASGAYQIKETQAPDGFNNLPGDITLNIVAGTDSASILNALSGNTVGGGLAAGDVSTGLVTLTISNTKGAVLPSTGGMGTTLFYVAGVVLMVGAAAVIMAKKRESK